MKVGRGKEGINEEKKEGSHEQRKEGRKVRRLGR